MWWLVQGFLVVGRSRKKKRTCFEFGVLFSEKKRLTVLLPYTIAYKIFKLLHLTVRG